MRAFILSIVLVLTSCAFTLAQDDGLGPESGAEENSERYQMLAISGRAMLLDKASGKSWLLAAKGDKAAWVPIQKLDDTSIASSWLKANLPARSGTKAANRPKLSMNEATRQVKLEEITDSEVSAEPFTVLVAREKAELTRLKSEYGDRHPEVLASRNRLRELLKVGAEGQGDRKN